MSMHLVVVGADDKAFDKFVVHPTSARITRIVNSGKLSLARIGNDCLARTVDDVFGLVHADTHYLLGALSVFEDAARMGCVAGIVGVCRFGHYHWCFENPGAVVTLDSCSVFFRTSSGLRFDEKTFDSFHCHVEDLCVQAAHKCMPVVVPSANATHASELPLPKWAAHHQEYMLKLKAKWPNFDVRHT